MLSTEPTKILILEDEPAHVEAIQRALAASRGPWEIRAASCLRLYRKLISTWVPDIALLDLIVEDGRSDSLLICPPDAGPFPMLVMTSHGDEQVAADAMRRGALDYIVKSPESFSEMPHIVERALRAWRVLLERRQTREALEASEDRYRKLFHNIADAIFVHDLEGRILATNAAACELYGYTLAEFASMNILGVSTAGETGPLFTELSRLQEDATFQFATRHRRKDDRLIAVEVNARRITWHNQAAVMSICRDVTAREQAQKQLRQLSRAVEQSPVSILITDTSGLIEYVNPKFTQVTGYVLDELQGLTPRILKSGTTSEADYKILWDTISRGREWRGELRNRRKNGELFWERASISPITDDTGRITHYLGVKEDITEYKRVEAELRENEEGFRTLVENAPAGIFVQQGGRFVYLNHTAVRAFGYSKEADLIGEEVVECFHPSFRDQVKDRIRLINEKGLAVSLAEEQCLRRDGSSFDAEFTGVPFVYKGKRGALVFFQDVSERKQLESWLRQSQKLEAIGQLAGGIAHDFNNILAAIMMHLGLLQMHPILSDDMRTSLQDLDAEARRAATLTRQLLMFSRRSVLEIKRVDVNEVAANLLKMLSRLIGEQIDLRFHPTPELPLVPADTAMLEQVLMNLVVNARDAMPHGGRITLASSLLELNGKELAGHPDRRAGRFVCLSVADTGCGMDAETQRRVFEPFFTTKEVGKGTGLGLSIVHGITAQHKGWIELESTPGEGSTFKVILPAMEKPATACIAPKSDPDQIKGGRETILLVEDDARVRISIAQTLRVLGYRVYEAANGQLAMNFWQTHHEQIDLVLTDMVMPEGMTGLELIERLQIQRPRLKSIISSGYSPDIVQADVLSRPGVVYLPKPYETRTLAKVVRQCLDAEAYQQQ
jgi:nitrogen fixation negative regulator NifL